MHVEAQAVICVGGLLRIADLLATYTVSMDELVSTEVRAAGRESEKGVGGEATQSGDRAASACEPECVGAKRAGRVDGEGNGSGDPRRR